MRSPKRPCCATCAAAIGAGIGIGCPPAPGEPTVGACDGGEPIGIPGVPPGVGCAPCPPAMRLCSICSSCGGRPWKTLPAPGEPTIGPAPAPGEPTTGAGPAAPGEPTIGL